MLAGFSSETRTVDVARLVSLPLKTLSAILIARGIPLEDIDEVEAAVIGVGVVITATDAIRYTFTRSPIPPQRFNTEHFPALYTATEESTCLAEIKHHINGTFTTTTERRYYQVLHVNFSGSTLVTAGHEGAHPDLISASSAGYPFCQALAGAARSAGHDALYAASARQAGGRCLPIFSEHSLWGATITKTIRFSFDGANVQHQVLV